MDVLIGRARGTLLFVARVAAVVLFIGLVARVPWVRDIDAAVERHRRTALATAIAFLGVSWIAFMSGVIYGVVAGAPGGSHTGARYAWRGAFGVEVSFLEVKKAARRGLWLTDPFWRFVFYMIVTAVAMGTGVCGLIFILGNAGIKGLIATVYLYAVVRVTWGFIQAR